MKGTREKVHETPSGDKAAHKKRKRGGTEEVLAIISSPVRLAAKTRMFTELSQYKSRFKQLPMLHNFFSHDLSPPIPNERQICILKHPRYHPLPEDEAQRTAVWKNNRRNRLRGSCLAAILQTFSHADAEKDAKEAYTGPFPQTASGSAVSALDRIIAKLHNKQREQCMAHGVRGEPHGVATLLAWSELFDFELFECSQILVSWPPELWSLIASEVKSRLGRDWTADEEDEWKHVLGVSPDLKLRYKKSGTEYAVEIKCGFSERRAKAYDVFKSYQWLQVQAECLALRTDRGYLLSWGERTSHLWCVPALPELWPYVIPILVDHHWRARQGMLPTPTTQEQSHKIRDWVEFAPREFVGVLPSCFSTDA